MRLLCMKKVTHVQMFRKSWMSLSALQQEPEVHDKLLSLIKATSGGADPCPPTVGHL